MNMWESCNPMQRKTHKFMWLFGKGRRKEAAGDVAERRKEALMMSCSFWLPSHLEKIGEGRMEVPLTDLTNR